MYSITVIYGGGGNFVELHGGVRRCVYSFIILHVKSLLHAATSIPALHYRYVAVTGGLGFGSGQELSEVEIMNAWSFISTSSCVFKKCCTRTAMRVWHAMCSAGDPFFVPRDNPLLWLFGVYLFIYLRRCDFTRSWASSIRVLSSEAVCLWYLP